MVNNDNHNHGHGHKEAKKLHHVEDRVAVKGGGHPGQDHEKRHTIQTAQKFEEFMWETRRGAAKFEALGFPARLFLAQLSETPQIAKIKQEILDIKILLEHYTGLARQKQLEPFGLVGDVGVGARAQGRSETTQATAE